ncbi:MAG TPA: MFS transporter [Kofleriaceae bacterium]|nr:MFS transporter [Kofleriaceae bacterium]
MESSHAKHPPPWLFAFTGTTYGVVGQFTGLVMPYATEHAGKELGSIGWYNALLFVPTFLLFLYAPLVDIGPRRKHWLVIVAALGAACLAAAFQMPLPEHIPAYLAFGFAAQLISGLVGSCSGGLMAASMPDELRGKAGGWYNVGNLSGGGLFAAIAIAMIGRGVDPKLIGAVVAVMMLGPALAALWIDEPPRPHAPVREVFRQTLREVGGVLLSRTGMTGILLSLSPVGTAALANFFSGMSRPYGVDADTVAVVTGLGTVGLNALGAFAGGYLCDRYNRRALYLIAGALTAVCGIAMAVSPRDPTTYVIGVTTYALITGFCYAAFTAYVLETIGKTDRTAATKYSLFTAASNLAITYVGWIDTRFSDQHGVEGVVTSDAALNLIGVAVLGLVFWRLGSFGRWRLAKR